MDFKEYFEKMTGHDPYPWQERLYKMFMKGDFPSVLDIPTGLGKTSIMIIWLTALINNTKKDSNVRIPSRLVYIVDRRVIVDQASEEAEKLQKSVENMKEISDIIERLNISKLRGGGGMADNRNWLTYPNNPAIIIGTVDMIGSKIFFSGYGLSNKIKPFYSGLLGQDSLIILDETHLSSALERSLKDMISITQNVKQKLFPPKIVLMSATQRNIDNNDKFGLDDEDIKNEEIRKRYKAKKHLMLIDTEEEITKVIIEHALKMKGRILIYIQKPKEAQEIAQKLKQERNNVVTLTGTLRGFERDKLTNNETYKAFLPDSHNKDDKTCFLVSTSAGEVGINLDADHIVCDLTTFDSLVQRLGRVNRSGGRESNIVIVYSNERIKKNAPLLKEPLENTKDLLKTLTKDGKYDANSHNLSMIKSDQIEKTWSPKPETQPLTKDILDMWSMTSIYEPYTSRPSVHHWLRGKSEFIKPETRIVWREDVEYITELDNEKVQDILDIYRILPHEIARDSSENVDKTLIEKNKKINGNKKIIIVESNGRCNIKEIKDIKRQEIEFATLLFPCNMGGLDSEGLLSVPGKSVKDVTDDNDGEKRVRILVKHRDNKEIYVKEEIGNKKIEKKLDEWIKQNPNMHKINTAEIKLDDDNNSLREIYYYVEKIDQQQSSLLKEQSLKDHSVQTENIAKKITKNLGLEQELEKAIIIAAKFHDEGKAREHWQTCMHVKGSEPLAKTKSGKKPLSMGGFRHELASVIDCTSKDEINKHAENDLILHLIAAHHGWARPCFKPNALRDNKEQELENVMKRYNNLQKRFGAFGLAWLEGLVRSADWQASKNLEESNNEK